MSGTSALYTRDVLALAASLGNWPLDPALPLRGEARSITCGSRLEIALACGADGLIKTVGIKAQSCAIGQASAAIFAGGVIDQDAAGVANALAAIRRWLQDQDKLPGWPGMDAIAAARGFAARHGAIILPWQAALRALSSLGKPG